MRKWLYFIAASIAGPVMLGCVLITTPALADPAPSPVSATATVDTVLTVSGISSTVSFGHVSPGATADAVHAEVYQVVTNEADGATVSIAPTSNAGFVDGSHVATGIPSTAVSITDSTGTVALPPSPATSTLLENVMPGQHNYDETWHLSVPGSALYSGAMSLATIISVVSNP